MTDVVCWACEVGRRGGDSAGLVHTCPDSGTWLAAEAHDAGEHDVASLGVYNVSLHFRIRSLDEQLARHKLTGLVSDLLDDDMVESADFFINEEIPA